MASISSMSEAGATSGTLEGTNRIFTNKATNKTDGSLPCYHGVKKT